MTPAALRAALDALRWSPRDLAEALNCDNRLVRRWVAGHIGTPPSLAAWLIGLQAAHRAAPPPKHWRSEQLGPVQRDAVVVIASSADDRMNTAVHETISVTPQGRSWTKVNFAKAMHLIVAGSVSVKVDRPPRQIISGAAQLSLAVKLMLKAGLAEHDIPRPFSTNAVRLMRSGQAIHDNRARLSGAGGCARSPSPDLPALDGQRRWPGC